MAGSNFNANDFTPLVNISFTDQNNIATMAECIGDPNVVALHSEKYAVGCIMRRQDVGSGNALYANNGTFQTPVWSGFPSLIGRTSGVISDPAPLGTTETWIGYQAGQNGGSLDNTVFIGIGAGDGATDAFNSTFIGTGSGTNATGAHDSVFIGPGAGDTAIDATQSIFIGTDAGVLGVNAAYSIIMGYQAGYQTGSGAQAVIMGNRAGYQAGGAGSIILGFESGFDSTNGVESVFIGWRAGYQATNANKSVFIGHGAGVNDTVDNNLAYGSILIGPATSTGGFSNSIAIGFNVTNTATNQFMIGSYDNIDTQIDEVIINGTGGIQVPVGTTAERIATQGMVRFNTDTSKFEGYTGGVWVDFH